MNNKREQIAIVSTYATDRKIYERSGAIEETPGGPLLFLKKALEELGLTPKIFHGENMLVEILVKEGDEFGKINEPRIKSPFPKVKAGSAIVSTLLDEWDLTDADQYRGKLFVDVQGYVRDGSAFGKKKSWQGVEDVAPNIFCLKGNSIEINMLPPEVVSDQKSKRMLITTRGKDGVEIFYQGQKLDIRPREVIKPKDTVGAGDTFFANFVYQFIKTGSTRKSAGFALQKTSEFLKLQI